MGRQKSFHGHIICAEKEYHHGRSGKTDPEYSSIGYGYKQAGNFLRFNRHINIIHTIILNINLGRTLQLTA